jgi:hypothetical protein
VEGERSAFLIVHPHHKKDRDGWEGEIYAEARSSNLMRPSPGFLWEGGLCTRPYITLHRSGEVAHPPNE